ncbi:MAG: LysM peptidoglycan-binding domain-containing protein [Acidimicrobiaceae bacterium]|nr:LysM peptidoglycan-binding domain-containing protein [Acidimicrobiaceae bacterium]
MNTNRPNLLRCAATVLLSLACAALLIEIDSSTPWPSTDPGAFLDWWERLGTATAAITLLRIVGIALAGWGIFIGTAGLLASIRPSGLLHGVWCRITPRSFRKILAVGAVTLTLSSPAVASVGGERVEAQIVLEDLGAAPQAGEQAGPVRFTPVLTDLGPSTVAASAEPGAAATPPPHSDTTASRIAGFTSAAPTAAPTDASPTGHPQSAAPTDAPTTGHPSSAAPTDTPTTGHPRAAALTDAPTTGHPSSAAPTDAPTTGHRVGSGSESQLWTVSEGDHLWKIATQTLRRQGQPTEPAAVLDYWRRLINRNSEALNGNPDLIHPGMVLALPPVPPRP